MKSINEMCLEYCITHAKVIKLNQRLTLCTKHHEQRHHSQNISHTNTKSSKWNIT